MGFKTALVRNLKGKAPHNICLRFFVILLLSNAVRWFVMDL